MYDLRPGLRPTRLVDSMVAAITRCRLDLAGTVVLTEAASGAYVVTPVIAALAGARRVFALTRPTQYGSVADVTVQTMALATLAGVAERVLVVTEKSPTIVAQADIVTNSGHLRPIDAQTIGWMKPSAVLPLRYEAWEYRHTDVDVAAARLRGIQVAGTNERHPNVGVFPFLGVMAVKLLLDAGIGVYGSTILVLCDNPFAPYLGHGLAVAGASVQICSCLDEAQGAADTVLVALRPRTDPVVGTKQAAIIAARWPNAVVAQFWGDIDRDALGGTGVAYWPETAPPPGHMTNFADAGPEPVVRLQAGGLKVAQVLLKPQSLRTPEDLEYIDEL